MLSYSVIYQQLIVMIKISKIIHLSMRNRYQFGKITNVIKRLMDSILKDESNSLNNRQIQNNSESSQVPHSEQSFLANQKKSLNVDRARLQKLDKMLGTDSYFYQRAPYQQRLDSEHLIEIESLKSETKKQSRQHKKWSNPQSQLFYQIKNKRRHYKAIANLAKYPNHEQGEINFNDPQDPKTIQFMSAESLFTNLSLKEVELKVESIMSESIGDEEDPIITGKFHYFHPQKSTCLVRIQKDKFTKELIYSEVNQLIEEGCQEIFSLEGIYNSLSKYDSDERVEEYLKKVEQGTMDYLVSNVIFNEGQTKVVVVVDLLGNNKQYCALYINLAQIKSQSQVYSSVIFNLNPSCGIIDNKLIYVRKSEEGNFIQLISRELDTQQQQIIYRAEPYNEIDIFTDQHKTHLFVREKQLRNKYKQKIMIIRNKPSIKAQILCPLGNGRNQCYTSPQGIIIVNFYPTQSFMQYGPNQEFSKQVRFIPIQKQNFNNQILALPQSNTVLYTCEDTEFIKEIVVKDNYLILNLCRQYAFNQNRLYFKHFNHSKLPHSLFLQQHTLKLLHKKDTSATQQCLFQAHTLVGRTQYSYLIWKRELKELLAGLKFQTLKVNDELEIKLHWSNEQWQKQMPIMIYVSCEGHCLNSSVVSKVGKKGVMIAQFMGRGSISKDGLYHMQGVGKNYNNFFDDLKECLYFLWNNYSQNVSLYAKGKYSSYISLIFLIQNPFLFRSSVLEDGTYDIETTEFTSSQVKQCKEVGINPLKINFKNPTETSEKLQIGSLDNILISCPINSDISSRKLMRRLRSNPFLNYPSLYLREYAQKDSDLYNIAYIISKSQNTP